MKATGLHGAPTVGLAGPLAPWRGGVAQHTTMLLAALRERRDVRAVTFARPVPPWLYPGRSQHEPDPAAAPRDAAALLAPASPAAWCAAARLLAEANVAFAVMPWWTIGWGPCLATIARLLRRRGIPTLFMCHNVSDHDAGRPWMHPLRRALLRSAAAFVTHSRAEADRVRALVPQARIAVHPHPVYTQFPAPASVPARRAAVELLFFGIVRPYKGLDVLAAALERLADADCFLTVAGEWWIGAPDLRARLLRTGRAEIIDRYIPAAEAAALFARADAVVLPYRDATDSGVVALAYRYNKPVIATRTGGLPEAIDDARSGLLVEPGSAEALVAAIRRFAAGPRDWSEGVRRTAARMTWDGLADCVIRTGQAVLGDPA